MVGLSGGGPYALACAHAMPERVVAVAPRKPEYRHRKRHARGQGRRAHISEMQGIDQSFLPRGGVNSRVLEPIWRERKQHTGAEHGGKVAMATSECDHY